MLPTPAIVSLWSACLLALAVASTNGADPVKLSVYYETLCGDSRRFVVDQMYPVWQDLKDIIVMDINVYGKATELSEEGGFSFGCQHGPMECMGNMMLTCAKHYMTEEKYLAFSNCVMDVYTGTDAGAYCAELVEEDYTPTFDCWNSLEGQVLLHEVGEVQRTLDPTLNYVPWILINDVYTHEQQSAAEGDLRAAICEAYQGEKPAQCNQ